MRGRSVFQFVAVVAASALIHQIVRHGFNSLWRFF